MNSNELFSIRLRELRLENNLTLEELSKKVDTTKMTLSRYENMTRSPQLEIVGKLANFFNVDMTWLGGFSNERRKTTEIQNLYDKLEKKRKKRVDDYIKKQLDEQEKEQ